MNIALEQTEEYVNGQLKNKYGDAFIRGNNGKYSFYLIIRCFNIIKYEYKFGLNSVGGQFLISLPRRRCMGFPFITFSTFGGILF